MISRRSALASLGALGALSARDATAAPEDRVDSTDTAARDFDVKEIFVEGERALGRRFTMLVPKHARRVTELPLVVALHGLGETHDEKLGAHAWLDLYGLRSAYPRLLAPPVTRTEKRVDFTDERLAEVNRSLAQRPFGGLVVVCPFTPNVKPMKDPKASLDRYAAWLIETVIPRARREARVKAGAPSTTLVGCSMGGSVALEVFSRKPEAFGGLGLVQGAVSEVNAPRWAEMLLSASKASGPRDVHLLTSEADPFVAGHRALAKALSARGVANELRVLPGPHDQPWLREAGTIEMLLYQDRRTP